MAGTTAKPRRKKVDEASDVVGEIKDRTRRQTAKEKQEEEKLRRGLILELLAQLGGEVFKDEDVLFKGKQLIIPEDMSLAQTVAFLENKIEEEEEATTFKRTFRYRPWDGAWCTWNALRDLFGAVGHRSSTVIGFFGPQKTAPEMLTINTDVDMQAQVPWGDFTVPYLPGLELSLRQENHPEFGPLFQIVATGPKKYRAQVEGLFREIQKRLEEDSMYRGKAFDGQNMPEFIDTYAVDASRVVYSEEVRHQIEANIYLQLRHSDATRSLGIPLKRAALVFGPYGTGKSLLGLLVAQVAIENGWTFIMARPGKDDLNFVMQTARLYQPAVVFFEDMDQVANPEAEADEMTQLLDTFDGIKSKGTELMVILTTNHPERIHKAMVRPGRLDAVIKIADLDVAGVQALIEANVPASVMGDELIDYQAVFDQMRIDGPDGMTHIFLPSFVKETGDRAMRHGLLRANGEVGEIQLNTEDFLRAAQDLHPQLELMSGARDTVTLDPLEMVHKRVATSVVEEVVAASIAPQFLTEEALERVEKKNGDH